MPDRLNLLFVFADQWRAQAFSHAGDPNARTPNLDAFARENLFFANAVSGCPVCTPYRACLMTGQYAHTHELVANDMCLAEHSAGPFLAEVLGAGGYTTAWFGKWHLDGHGRSQFVPPERRLGFDFWQGYECNHAYRNGFYYEGNNPEPHPYPGYDADAQTDNVCAWLRGHRDEPFACFLSWGPPHAPFGTAPEHCEAMFAPDNVVLRPNVPTDNPEVEARARRELAGYYAHGAALDACWGRLMTALDETGLAANTVVVFTSDHGDMLGSQGHWKKQVPWAESVSVPFICRYPRSSGHRVVQDILDSPDLMPTLLGTLDLDIPPGVQGRDLSPAICEGRPLPDRPALLACYLPFHQWKYETGGFEYRGLRDRRWTYTRNLEGPWLLYDDLNDPHQQHNLVSDPAHTDIRQALDRNLERRLDEIGDAFLPGPEYIRSYAIPLDETGDVLVRP